jgi:hypothetical protein
MSGADTIDVSIFSTKDDKATQISLLWSSWLMARRKAEEIWQEVYNYCNASDARQTSNVQNPWDNSTNLPKMAQIADNLEANYEPAMFPNNEWFRFEPFTANAANKEIRAKVEAYVSTKNRLNNFYLEMAKCRRDWIYTGNAFGEVKYVTETAVDRLGQEYVTYTGPKFYRISPYDIVFNPLATSFEKSPKIIRKLYTRGELELLAEGTDRDGWAREILDKVDRIRYTMSSLGDKDSLKYNSMHFDGFGNTVDYFRSGYVEVLEFYGDLYDGNTGTFHKGKRFVVVDRMWLAEEQDIATPTGAPHIFHCGWRLRPDNLWAQGPLELLVGLQYRLNHLENAKADAFDQQLDADLVYRGTIDVIQDGARKIYISEDTAGDVRRLAPDASILNANMEIDWLMRLMEETAGAPKDAVGIRTPGEKTAFEVGQLFERSGRVFQNKVSYFERVFTEPVINAELAVARDNVHQVDTIPVIGDEDGIIDFLDISKEDLSSNGKLVPIGARHYARQAQLIQTIQALQSGLLTDPDVKMHISGQRLAEVVVDELLNFHKFDLYKPYVRIFEQAEAQKYMQAAQSEIMAQDQMEAQGLGGEEVSI